MSSGPPIGKILKVSIESNLKYKYSLEISNNSKLNILIKSITKIPIKNYEENFSLEKIKNISKYFLICETIDEVIYSIEESVLKSQLIEDNGKIKLVVNLNHPLCKEAIFIINEKKKDINESINELYDMIYDLKKTVQNQQDTINTQEKEIEKLKERINTLENKEKLNENIDNYFKDSLIISNNYDVNKNIKNWINLNKKIEFKLLFRKSRDGTNCSDFHKFCDHQGSTLCLIQTTKNYIFGGYTTISWESEINLKNDDSAFLFSLDLMQKFTKYKGKCNIFSDNNFGPCFGEGGGDLYLNSDLNLGYTSSGNILRNCELTKGEIGDFQVKEFEVYKVIIN